jgi:predicted SnoaL-like aldol condensation-catalyzing enzyme
LNFTNHNPSVLDGLAASFDVVKPIFTNPAVEIQILHQAFAEPVGWVHYRIDGFLPEPTAVVDVYLWGGGCIVEHWDIIQERPVNATNSHALF